MKIDVKVLKSIESESNISSATLKESIENGINDAYQRLPEHAEFSRAELDLKTGAIRIFSQEVVERDDEGQPSKFKDIREENPSDFSRIAAAAARKTISQRVQDARAGYIFEEYKQLKYSVISGIIQQVADSDNVKIKLPSGFEAFLPAREQISGEKLIHGEYLKVFVLEVERGNRGPDIVVSRTHPGLVRKLFELEVPEIGTKTVEIVSVAREAGIRSKVAVASNDPNVNPVAALIGELGRRVRTVVEDLGQEKIDIIAYSPQPEIYLANALSPAEVNSVEVVDEAYKIAKIIVPENKLSLAIGKEGLNVRLAAKLTGWKIDVIPAK
jgi:N utilization substance protein A